MLQSVSASLPNGRNVEIARALNIQPDPPTPSPRTALFRKRKFEQCSDSESEEEEGEDRRPGPTAGRADGVQGQRVYPEMSGALQEGQDDDDMHLYSDD